MKAICGAALLWLCASPVWADARVTMLLEALQLDDIVAILHEEGLAYGRALDADMLDGKGGPFWAAQVARIYDTQRIKETIRRALEGGLEERDLDAALTFFGSDAGAKIIALENAARQAISDPDVEEAARARYRELSEEGEPRVGLVARYIDVNDLLERNVSSAMTANYQFLKGLSDGGYHTRPEAEIVEDVWAQQDDIREDTLGWLRAYLMMSYQPLPPDVLEGYLDYSASREGRALNAALFDGFERVYSDISYALGRAISLMAKGDEI